MGHPEVKIGDRIDEAVLAREVQGQNLTGRTLAEAIGDLPTVLAFLRHFG